MTPEVVARIEAELKGSGMKRGAQSVSQPEQPARVGVRLDGWRREGFGTVAVADFTVFNYRSTEVGDVGVRCRFVAESGTTLKEISLTLHNTFAPASKRQIKNFNVGMIPVQTQTLYCNAESEVGAPVR